MSDAELRVGSIVCIGFVNGGTIIGTLAENNGGMAILKHAYTVTLVKNPESKERNFVFKPTLTMSLDQTIGAAALEKLITGESVIAMYRPAETVESGYRDFIVNSQLVAKVLRSHCMECGPSKEFVDKVMAETPKPKPRVEDGVIKGVFCPTMVMIDDEEGQG